MDLADLVLANHTRKSLTSGHAAELRVAAGVSQSGMAAALGVTEDLVDFWETGRCLPSAPLALAYGRFLAEIKSRPPSPHRRCEGCGYLETKCACRAVFS